MKGLGQGSDAEFVDALYAQLLSRGADPGGRQDMLARLAGGASRLELVDLVLASAEFQAIRRTLRFAQPGHFYSPHPGAREMQEHATFDWDRATLPAID